MCRQHNASLTDIFYPVVHNSYQKKKQIKKHTVVTNL